MTKKAKALEKLGQVIQDMELKAGDRLPPERRLVDMLDVSRNTLRSILHSLEARGWSPSVRAAAVTCAWASPQHTTTRSTST